MGDGRLGYPDGAPYDAIHVGAAAATVPKAVRTSLSHALIQHFSKSTVKVHAALVVTQSLK